MNRIRKTGIRFNLTPQDCSIKEIKQWMTAQRKLTNYASAKLFDLITTDEAVKQEVYKYSGDSLISAAQRILVEKTDFRQYRESLGFVLAINERIATAVAGRFYLGFARRNGKMVNGKWEHAIPNSAAKTRQNKAVHLIDNVFKMFIDGDITITKTRKNGLVDLANITFQLRGLNGIKHNFSASIPKNQFKLLKFLRERAGNNCYCNMFFQGETLTIVVLVDQEYELAYEYKNVLALDFNVRSNVFVAMNDETTIARSQLITDTAKAVGQLDKDIHAAIDAKTRAPLRHAWKAKRKQLRKLLTPIAQEIVNKAIQNKSLLAIDGVTMPNSGTFGHAELKEMLLALCQQYKIPFVFVPSPHTSSDCAVCQTPVGRSPDKELVSCNKCKKNYHADFNAAKNIAYDGKIIFDGTTMDLEKKSAGRPTTKQRGTKKPEFVNYDVF